MRPQLKKQAVPTKFGDVPTGNCEPLHEYAKRICNVSVESSNMMKPSIQIISTLVGEFSETKSINYIVDKKMIECK